MLEYYKDSNDLPTEEILLIRDKKEWTTLGRMDTIAKMKKEFSPNVYQSEYRPTPVTEDIGRAYIRDWLLGN